MEFNLNDISNAAAEGLFVTGDTVTITIYDKDGNDVTPVAPDDSCTEIGTTGIFEWKYSNLDSLPTEYERYVWIMENQAGIKQRDVDVFVSYPNAILQVPFDIDITKYPVNKGDVWEPVFRVDYSGSNLKVAVELADMATIDYDQTVVNKYTSNIIGGGDDQVLLIADANTFKLYRLFITEAETASFGSRFFDIKITVQTSSGQTVTVLKKKIPFTEVEAISFDTA